MWSKLQAMLIVSSGQVPSPWACSKICAMARAIWKGGISFGLVNVPVSLYATSESSDVTFRQLHRKDLAPIQYRRVCSQEGVEVPGDEIVKGYEYAKDSFVIMSDDELAKARVEATQTIDVRDFVPADDIPWTFFENAYYVEPAKIEGKEIATAAPKPRAE